MRHAALALIAALIASPALAGTYSATPAAQPTKDKVITRDIAWTYADGRFTGRTEESRPMVLCQGLAKRTGRLDGFIANGRAFDPAKLAKCNKYAPEGAATLAKRK